MNAGNKEEQKYRSFDEVKRVIEQRLTGQKQEKAMEEAMEQLKKDYNVAINEDYFQKVCTSTNEVENEEQLEMVMPEAPAKAA